MADLYDVPLDMPVRMLESIVALEEYVICCTKRSFSKCFVLKH